MATQLWESQLRRGSFAGIAFSTTASESTSGRRAALYEMPYSDTWMVEDMGAKPRTYTLNVFVSGSTYRSQRDKLLDALNTRGEQKLVHPYYGSFQCQVQGDVGVSEGADKGGIAYISFTVVRIEPPKVAKFNHEFEFLDAVDKVLTEITDGFANVFDIVDQVVEVVDRANSISQKITEITQSLVQLANLPRAVSSSLLGDIRDVQNACTTLAYSPLDLALSVSGLFTNIAITVMNTPSLSSEEQQSTLNTMLEQTLAFPALYPPEPAYDETTTALNRNTQAQVALVVGSLLLACYRIAVGMKTVSKEHGASNKAKLVALSYTLAPRMNYDGFRHQDKVRSLALKCIDETTAKLGHTRTIMVDTPTPLLVLAHKLGTSRESLLELNIIPNPMFTKGLIRYIQGEKA